MKTWLTSLFLIMALAGGVLAGTPMHSGNMNNRMMKCCKKAKSKQKSPQANAARLCCALNCTNSVPAPSGSSFNFAPTAINISESVISRIASLFKKEKPVLTVRLARTREHLSQEFQPKYIQHHSFLI